MCDILFHLLAVLCGGRPVISIFVVVRLAIMFVFDLYGYG
jgi:hypothetical protein